MSDAFDTKAIIGWEGLYSIDTEGKVFSLRRNRYIKSHKDSSGYMQCTLTLRNKSKHILLHRLVALHFIDNPNGLPQVNHKDGDKVNNKVSNLEWCTCRDNIAHAFSSGLRYPAHGESVSTAKLRAEDVLEIRKKYSNGEKSIKLAKQFGVHPSMIWLIVTRKNWRHI